MTFSRFYRTPLTCSQIVVQTKLTRRKSPWNQSILEQFFQLNFWWSQSSMLIPHKVTEKEQGVKFHEVLRISDLLILWYTRSIQCRTSHLWFNLNIWLRTWLEDFSLSGKHIPSFHVNNNNTTPSDSLIWSCDPARDSRCLSLEK